MIVVQVNATSGVGSTGKICLSISKLLTEEGIENYILFSQNTCDDALSLKYMSTLSLKTSIFESRLFGNYGFENSFATKHLIDKLKRIKPDIVQLHNIHSHNCNIGMLFNYLKSTDIKTIWTFHDCWAFTGYCTYFSYVECNKWQSFCSKCPKYHDYSFFVDRSFNNHQRKKELYSDYDFTIVTPSKWLAELSKQSFLQNHKTVVINNGIDLSVFHPIPNDFKDKHGITGKMILGVSFEWGLRKGLDVFVKLANRLPENYFIVLVGTSEEIEKQLPGNIITIRKTTNQSELAKIYSAADVFVNPTREDNYPTVNMEAIACGTPVITFKTGGSVESIDNSCGMIVEQNDVDGLIKAIIAITNSPSYLQESLLNKAKAFDQSTCFQQYIELYKSLM